ncbi:MAG: YlmH/Sll1252 family protein [Lachnospiraceae bacterium]|nr:YlmH/Sll1252 family protein [Lachnospiraceae bacterium]
MDDNTEFTIKKLQDLEKRSYNNNTFEFSDFLTIAEASEFRKVSRSGEFFGGYDMAERRVIRFGDPEELGYEVPYPIDCVKISPVSEKFSSAVTHRDFLGAVMNLGVDRRVFGDILVKDKGAYMFCLEHITEYLCDNLVSVGRNQVHVEKAEFPAETFENNKEKITIQVSSPRADAIIAHVCHLSRGNVGPYFARQYVQLNGALLERPDKLLKDGDIFSVRGFGKFIVGETTGQSKKGKDNIIVFKYC